MRAPAQERSASRNVRPVPMRRGARRREGTEPTTVRHRGSGLHHRSGRERTGARTRSRHGVRGSFPRRHRAPATPPRRRRGRRTRAARSSRRPSAGFTTPMTSALRPEQHDAPVIVPGQRARQCEVAQATTSTIPALRSAATQLQGGPPSPAKHEASSLAHRGHKISLGRTHGKNRSGSSRRYCASPAQGVWRSFRLHEEEGTSRATAIGVRARDVDGALRRPLPGSPGRTRTLTTRARGGTSPGVAHAQARAPIRRRGGAHHGSRVMQEMAPLDYAQSRGLVAHAHKRGALSRGRVMPQRAR